MSVAIVDTGGANIGSVRNALERLGVSATLTTDAAIIQRAPRVILPGVGAAADSMARLRDCDLIDVITGLTQPVLGICLGIQLLFEHSDEGDVAGLGIIPGRVHKLAAAPKRSVPHMGWNQLEFVRSDNAPPGRDLFAGLDAPWMFFVHSYYCPQGPWTTATATHGTTFSAACQWKNFAGMQFHPERSGKAGAMLLDRFLADDAQRENAA